MADLGVAHLAVGQADGRTRGVDLRRGVDAPGALEERRVGERGRVAGAAGTEPEAVQDDQHHRAGAAHHALPAALSSSIGSASPQSRSRA